MITLNYAPNDHLLELGGGARPVLKPNCQGGNAVCVDVRMCVDEKGNPTVDFTADFNEPLPISSDEFDGLFCQYTLEHLSWRRVRDFLKECVRVLKPGCKACFVVPNTDAQLEWMRKNPNGWDGKNFFESVSCMLFGDQDYPENTHKIFLNPDVVHDLFEEAGFINTDCVPYGERDTDMVIMTMKPDIQGIRQEMNRLYMGVPSKQQVELLKNIQCIPNESLMATAGEIKSPEEMKGEEQMPSAEKVFDREYFNGGKKFGGYAREGYWDYPVHDITARHVLSRNPKSVLELGCARGYVGKRIQDAGVGWAGLEVSRHCYLTRACNGIINTDILKMPWVEVAQDRQLRDGVDLGFSIAFLEHVPEGFVPELIHELSFYVNRHLHGIDFGQKDDGFDRTHCTLRPKEWWEEQFRAHGAGKKFEIVDKEELEQGQFPEDVLKGDGRVKLNVGCAWTMFHYGWLNVDVLDLRQFADAYKYNFQQWDVRNGLPYNTGTVDMIYCCHMLEHLNYNEGRSFLRECKRVLKPGGMVRIVVPDARLLMEQAVGITCNTDQFWKDMGEVNENVAKASTQAMKCWELLHSGHQAQYDQSTLWKMFHEAKFNHIEDSYFRQQTKMSRETIDMLPCLSLYMNAYA